MAITKSGTHDSSRLGYDFYRNEELNANNFFSNRTGTVRPALPLSHQRLPAGRPDLHTAQVQ
jgi:hypothetical protein